MSAPADNRIYREPVRREVVWPGLLIVTLFAWALHYSMTAEPLFGQRWLLIICTFSLWFSASIRIWCGRFDA